jgi:hypothetical protein
MNVLKAERSSFRVIGVGVLAWAQQEEETQGDHLPNGLHFGIAGGVAVLYNVLDNLEWNGFDPGWQWVFLGICL